MFTSKDIVFNDLNQPHAHIYPKVILYKARIYG